ESSRHQAPACCLLVVAGLGILQAGILGIAGHGVALFLGNFIIGIALGFCGLAVGIAPGFGSVLAGIRFLLLSFCVGFSLVALGLGLLFAHILLVARQLVATFLRCFVALFDLFFGHRR